MVTNQFPKLDDFKIFLSDQRDIVCTSSIKSYYRFLTKYFSTVPFVKENLRSMLHALRTDPNKPLKRSTLNKYIRVAKLLAQYMGSHEFDDFSGYRNHDSETKPMGDLLTDKEMREVAELRIKYKKRSKKQREEINNKYHLAISLLRFVGMPPVDLCNLKWSSYKITHLDYFRHKTGKHMIVPIPHKLREMFDVIVRSSEYVFGTGLYAMKEATLREEVARRAKILGINKRVTPYGMRASAVTWCYMNGSDKVITSLADIFGHTVEVAKKHYQLYRDPNVLLDALTSAHPGLKRSTSIDTVKRLAIDFLSRLIDLTKWEVDLTIKPKEHNIRHLTIS